MQGSFFYCAVMLFFFSIVFCMLIKGLIAAAFYTLYITSSTQKSFCSTEEQELMKGNCLYMEGNKAQ